MKDNLILIIITALFVLTGLVLSFFAFRDFKEERVVNCIVEDISYKQGEEIPDYQENHTCVYGNDGFIDCIPSDSDEEETNSTASDLQTEGLNFEYTYLTGLSNGNGSLSFEPVTFSSVNIKEGSLIVILEHKQTCVEANRASEQVGFYEKTTDLLKLYNMVRIVDDSGIPCMVELKYVFEDISDLDLENIKIAFVHDDENLTYASICIYDQKIYSEDDVFKNSKDEMCTCLDGEIECESI